MQELSNNLLLLVVHVFLVVHKGVVNLFDVSDLGAVVVLRLINLMRPEADDGPVFGLLAKEVVVAVHVLRALSLLLGRRQAVHLLLSSHLQVEVLPLGLLEFLQIYRSLYVMIFSLFHLLI